MAIDVAGAADPSRSRSRPRAWLAFTAASHAVCTWYWNCRSMRRDEVVAGDGRRQLVDALRDRLAARRHLLPQLPGRSLEHRLVLVLEAGDPHAVDVHRSQDAAPRAGRPDTSAREPAGTRSRAAASPRAASAVARSTCRRDVGERALRPPAPAHGRAPAAPGPARSSPPRRPGPRRTVGSAYTSRASTESASGCRDASRIDPRRAGQREGVQALGVALLLVGARPRGPAASTAGP